MDIYDIGNKTELFVDGRMAEHMAGSYYKLHSPELREAVLVANDSWERGLGYSSVISDGDGGFFLYYRGFGEAYSGRDDDTGQVTCICHSDDGINFERMNIGAIAINGSKRNNIILKGVASHNFTPFYDANPDCDPRQRFKAMAGISNDKNAGAIGGLYAYASADGIGWEKLCENPVITDGLFDSQNIAFYDAAIGKYRCYSRYWDEGGSSAFFNGYRAIQSCVSDDFMQWSPPVHNDYGEPVAEHFYTNGVAPCPGAGHILLSFPKRFNPERKKVMDHVGSGISDAIFMASRDGVNWNRLFKTSWLRPGLDMRNWTDRNMLIGAGIVAMPDGSFSLYYTEHNHTPDNRLRRLSIRKHGFVSLSAGWETGFARTPALLYEGGLLRLNYSTSAAGYIKAWIAEAGELPGPAPEYAFTLYGDALDEAYPLYAIENFKGRAVRIYFELRDADIFSFYFG